MAAAIAAMGLATLLIWATTRKIRATPTGPSRRR
jgi:hypothetical protein